MDAQIVQIIGVLLLFTEMSHKSRDVEKVRYLFGETKFRAQEESYFLLKEDIL